MSTGYPGELESLDELFDEPAPSDKRIAAAVETQATHEPAAASDAQPQNVEMAPPATAAWTTVLKRTAATLLPIIYADAIALIACGAIVQVSMQFLYGEPRPLFAAATFALLPLILAYWLSGLYSEIWLHSVLELRQLTHVSTVSITAAAVGGMMTGLSFPIWWAVALLLVLVAVPLMRRVVRRWCARCAWWGYPTLIIGAPEGADAAARTLIRATTSGLRPVLMHDPEGGERAAVRPIVNDLKALEARVRDEAIQHAVVSMPHLSTNNLAEIVDRYTGLVPHLLVLSHCSTLPALWGASRGCGGLSGIEVRNGLLLRTLQAAKRVIDLGVAAITLVLCLPLLVVIAGAIKLSGRGAVLFAHQRIGRHGRTFRAWKFRTMHNGADEILRAHLDSDASAKMEWDSHQKLRNDPRVTAVGRFLRRTSLDELPQTWNVLVGDMSIVGPRPIVSEEIRRYGEALRLYCTVKPGITGLWQVSGRNDVSYQQRVQLDQFYIRHWSPWLDLHILAKTIVVLIKRKGAYQVVGERGSKHVLSHAAIYLVARGLPGVVAFLAIPLFTRLLEPAAYGRYALVIATVAMLNALVFQWLRLSLSRYLAAFQTTSEQQKLKSTLVTTAGLIIVALGLLAAMAALLPPLREWREVILIGWVVLAAQSLFELCCEYSRASLKPWRFMALQFARSGAAVGIGVLLIKAGFGWWGPIIGVAIGMVIGIAYAGLRDWTDVRFTIDRDVLAKLCRYGMPLSLTVALAVVISVSDRFLIAFFMGEDAAGLYAVAFDFTCQTLTLLMMAVNLAAFPMAVRAYESHGPAAAKEQMRHNGSLLVAIGLPCVVGLTVLSPGIVNCFFGADYRAAAMQIMPLIALGAFLEGMKAYHFDAAFQFVHRTIVQVWIVLLVAIANIGANLLVIPRWGIAGAAVVSAGAYVLSIGLTIVIGRRHFALPLPAASCARAAIGCVAMAALLWPFRSSIGPMALAAQVAGGVALYGVVLIAMNFLGLRDAIVDRFGRRPVAAGEVVV